MTEGQGNYFFCKESPIARLVMKEELLPGGITMSPDEGSPWGGKGHRWRCNHWLKQYEKDFKKAGVKSSADVRKLEDAGKRFPMDRKIIS